MKRVLISFVILSIAFLFLACASSASKIPKAPMPANATFTGLWYSSFGDMKLTQVGEKVRGTFEYRKGGEIDGDLHGGVLRFSWVQPGDFAVGRREVSGKGYLVISNDGLNLKGEWGYGEEYVGGGEWIANKATELY